MQSTCTLDGKCKLFTSIKVLERLASDGELLEFNFVR